MFFKGQRKERGKYQSGEVLVKRDDEIIEDKYRITSRECPKTNQATENKHITHDIKYLSNKNDLLSLDHSPVTIYTFQCTIHSRQYPSN